MNSFLNFNFYSSSTLMLTYVSNQIKQHKLEIPPQPAVAEAIFHHKVYEKSVLLTLLLPKNPRRDIAAGERIYFISYSPSFVILTDEVKSIFKAEIR